MKIAFDMSLDGSGTQGRWVVAMLFRVRPGLGRRDCWGSWKRNLAWEGSP